jgi:hypothetical protein
MSTERERALEALERLTVLAAAGKNERLVMDAIDEYRGDILVALGGHDWEEDRSRFGWPYCRICGVVKRADGKNKPCRGSTPKVALRAQP